MQLLFTVDGACVWSVRDGHGGCRDLEGAGAFARFENPKKIIKKTQPKLPSPKYSVCDSLAVRLPSF